MRDSLSMSKTRLPKDTRELNIRNIDNFYLKFLKAARYEDDDKFKFFHTHKGKVRYQIKADFSKVNFKEINDRYYQGLESLYDKSLQKLVFKPQWRMVVGLGSVSVYEVSMTLHHIYGFPYIPGSAVKGITRSWVINEAFGEDEKGELDLIRAEKRALQDKEFCDIFGCPEKDFYEQENEGKAHYSSYYKESRKGNIIFFDAMPMQKPKIEVDVMNPHYGDYYKDPKHKPPGDYYNPTPIYFLTVADTPFVFYIASSEKGKDISQHIVKGKSISDWLQEALTEHGIGAKTAVGYGLMKYSN